MLSSRSAPLIDLDIRPSRQLAAFVVVSHLLTIGAVLAAGIPWPARTAAAAIVIASLARECLQGQPGIGPLRRAVWFPDGQWTLIDMRGRSVEAELVPGLVCLAQLVLVRLRPVGGGRARVLVLAADSADRDSLRRLRTRLRLEA